MIRTTLYTCLIAIFCIACNDSKPVENGSMGEPQIVEVDNSETLSSRGAILMGSESDAHFIMEAESLKLEADAANKYIDSLEQLCAQDTSNIDANFAFGTELALGCDWDGNGNLKGCNEAIESLTRVISTDPNYKNGAAYFNRGQAYISSENWEAATKDLNAYLEIDKDLPSAYAYLLLAKAAFEQGNKDKACEHVQHVKDGLPGQYNSTYNIWTERCGIEWM
ncbi:MAG: hypothetical protein GY810_05855 [Aureispira sp.]|nr:hypothetical protein [Aureispira sp.]